MSGKFLLVRCECNNDQMIFEKACQEVKCLVCGKTLASPTGGKADISAKVIRRIS